MCQWSTPIDKRLRQPLIKRTGTPAILEPRETYDRSCLPPPTNVPHFTVSQYISSSMSIPSTVKQITLHERPTAAIEPTTFKTIQVAGSDLIAKLKEDQVIVRVDYVSLDPAMRGWLNSARSYLPPVQIGEVMRAGGLGEVVKVGSAVTKVKPGDFVQATTG